MSEEAKGLEESIKGYKEKVSPEMKLKLHLERDLVFAARTQRGYVIDYDAKVEWGCMPTESLLASIAGCMAIDVVSFLRKMKAEIEDFVMEAKAVRNPDPPQYFKAVVLAIKIKGKGIDKRKMDRAIALSKDKYCSVYHTLRPDMEHVVKYEIEDSNQ